MERADAKHTPFLEGRQLSSRGLAQGGEEVEGLASIKGPDMQMIKLRLN